LPVSLKGVQLLQFTTAMPLRDAVRFVLSAYPAAGYVIDEGDSEQDEADVPFTSTGLHGKTRISATGPCETTWLVATDSKGSAALDKVPQLSPHSSSSKESSDNGD
jgi:hypothetical protein